MRRSQVLRRVLIGLTLAAVLLALSAAGWRSWFSSNAPTYVARDEALRRAPLFFYPATSGKADAFVFFFGNDVAFWEPHKRLVKRMSRSGYSAVGLDLRKYLDDLPSESVAARDSAFASRIPLLIAAARHELGADSLPMVLGGHSFGAEVALWTALHAPPPGLAGVLVMSTRGNGHFFVRASDWKNDEPSGEGSFSTIEIVRALPPSVRVALVRGEHDPFIHLDSTFVVAGGGRLHHYVLPTIGHSIRNITIAGWYVDRAMNFLLETRAASR